MAEYNIANNAGTITADKKTAGPWICRDDSGNYWTIFQDIDNNIAICKTTDAGETWTLMKTLTTADFTSLTFPVDTFSICHLIGQNKVYVFLAKKGSSSTKSWGWIINTLTDVGTKDLDNVSISHYPLGRLEVRWDTYNNKLYSLYGYLSSGFSSIYTSEIKLDTTFGVETTITISQYKIFCGFAIDSNGNKFSLVYSNNIPYFTTIHKGTGTPNKDTTYNNVAYLFANVVCDYDNKVIFGFVIGTVFHTYRANNALTTFEINDSQVDLGAGHTPAIAFLTVDGTGDIYWVYTDSNDNEAYFIKYTIATSSWGSATKISSDNDGKLICPELRPTLSDNKILVSYQATA